MESAWRKRLGDDVYDHLLKTSKKKGIDHVLVLNVWQQESKGKHNAVSEAGAIGIGQVMPFHFRNAGIANIGHEEWDHTIKHEVDKWGRDFVKHSKYRTELEKGFNATKNATASIGILANALKQARRNVGLALAIYNGGGYGKRKFKAGYPCAPYVRGKRNDCLQNKYYVKNIYSAYLADLKNMEGKA
jgi:soluble lytic murein transglycosylase-like protein